MTDHHIRILELECAGGVLTYTWQCDCDAWGRCSYGTAESAHADAAIHLPRRYVRSGEPLRIVKAGQ